MVELVAAAVVAVALVTIREAIKAWYGKPCLTCQRLMDGRRPPHAYIPPTATHGFFRIVCGPCARGQ